MQNNVSLIIVRSYGDFHGFGQFRVAQYKPNSNHIPPVGKLKANPKSVEQDRFIIMFR